MSARARDVLPLTVGAYLLLLGIILLIDSTGLRSLGVAGLVGAAFGLAFVAFGVLAILAALRLRHFRRRLRRAVGHVRSTSGWTVDDAVISTVFGDISLDLRDGTLPEGETDMTLLCWLGTIHVRVPREVGVDVTAQTMVGTLDVLGRREQGFVRDVHVRSERFDEQERRLTLRLSTVVGELFVVHH